MKTLFSFLSARKFAIGVTVGVLAAIVLGAIDVAANPVLPGAIVGMSWATDDNLVIKLLASRGLVNADSALLNVVSRVLAKTVDYTVLGTEGSGTTFTTRGAAGAVIFTLPAAAARFAGIRYRFHNLVDQNMTITGTADTMITFNDLTADSVAASTAGQKIGAVLEAFCDGTSWCVTGVSVGHTFTVAT